MLQFFRINAPYRLLGFFLICLAMGLPFLIDPVGILSAELKAFVVGEAITEGKIMYVQVYDNTSPLASIVFGCINWLFGRSLLLWRLTALFIILLQASYFTLFLVNTRACKENTLLPALLFGTLCFFSFDLVSLSAELLGSGVLLIALKKLFDGLTSKVLRGETILGIGVCVGLATLLVFSYWIFLFAALLILTVFRSMELKKVGLLIYGFLLPHLLLITLYYYWGNENLLWHNFYAANLALTGKATIPVKGIIVLVAFIGMYWLFSWIMTGQSATMSRKQLNIMQAMWIWLGFSAVHIFLSSEITPSSLIILIPSLSYLINHRLLLIKKRMSAEIMLWIFLGGVLGMSLTARYGKIDTVNYSALFPALTPYDADIKNKKILVLGQLEGLYRNNRLGGFFLNWELSRPLFEDMSSYDYIDKIAWCFKEDPPEIIVDEQNLMPQVMEKIPTLKRMYVRESNRYRRTQKLIKN